jgi:hypothetical protein
MAITTYLDIDQGSDYSLELVLENANGTPMNLSDFTVYSQFRKSYNSTTAYNFVTSIPQPTQGKIKLQLSGVVSSQIKPGRYIYDVEIISSSPVNNKTRVVEGIVTINPEITKIP